MGVKRNWDSAMAMISDEMYKVAPNISVNSTWIFMKLEK